MIVQLVRKEHGNPKRNSSIKQKGPQLQRTREPGKTITVQDNYLITMNLKDSSDLPFSLQDKNNRLLWYKLNRKLKFSWIEPLTVKRLTPRAGFQALESSKTPTSNVHSHCWRGGCSAGQSFAENRKGT